MTEAVTLRDVSYRVGAVTILRDVAFNVPEGEVFALFGPSGCGKSTTLRLISGLEQASTGEVRVFGKPATSYGHAERRVATVWQGRALFPHLNVTQNLEFGLRSRGVEPAARAAKVAAMARRLHIEGLLEREVAALSGGEQQRVALGRAMIVDPDVLLLDEPFTGLDQMLRWRFLAELQQLLARKDRTYVLVSHEFETILALATSTAVMNAGTVIHVGRPEEIWRYPVSGFVAQLIGWSNVFVARPTGVADQHCIEVAVGPSTWRGRVRWSSAEGPRPSDQAAYVLHPHDIELGNHGSCTVEGLLVAQESRATDDYLFFELPGAGVMRVRLPRLGRDKAPTIGERVPLTWNDTSALVVPA